MTSLAVIFILLLVVFLKQAHNQGSKAREEVKDGLSSILEQKNLKVQQDNDDPFKLTVMMGELHVRFPLGRATLNAEGREFVNGFFKTFAAKICEPAMRNRVESVAVEGNTDTSGEQTSAGVRKNIAISQQRAYAVLERGLDSIESNPRLYECMLALTSASGRGSRNPILVNGAYSADLSRRVEFKIRVRSNMNSLPPPPPPISPSFNRQFKQVPVHAPVKAPPPPGKLPGT